MKTVGLQAQFDVLRALAGAAYKGKDVRQAYFMEKLAPAAAIDFSDAAYQNASGSGRTAIRKAISGALGLS